MGLALLVLGTVGACTGGADPPATGAGTGASSGAGTGTGTGTGTVAPGTSSPSSTTAATSTVGSVPEIPEAARAHTKAGAEAFVRFYMEQANRAWTEPNTALLPSLSDKGCLSCKDIQATAVALQEKGQRYASRPVTVTRVAAFGGAPKGQQFVRLFMTQHKVNVIDSSGNIVLTDPKKSLARTAGVVWEGQSWRMYDIGA